MPPSSNTFFFHYTIPGIKLGQSMVGRAGRSWSLATTACQDLSWTLDTSVQLASKIGWGIVENTKVSFDLTITFGVPPFSHNVATKNNYWLNTWNGQCFNKKQWCLTHYFAYPHQIYRFFGPRNRTKHLP